MPLTDQGAAKRTKEVWSNTERIRSRQASIWTRGRRPPDESKAYFFLSELRDLHWRENSRRRLISRLTFILSFQQTRAILCRSLQLSWHSDPERRPT